MVERRVFLKQAALGTAALGAGGASHADAASGAVGADAAVGLPLQEASAVSLAQALAEGRTSAAALVAGYTARIAAIDRSGPALNAVIEPNPEAAAIAEALDRERAAGRVRGPLHGLPVLLKDNIATADAMQTSAGSPALLGAKAPRDAFVVRRLREAGAVILGKTNLSEWANIRGEHSISGFSTRGGQTLNPYALDRSPSGSSSGTGSAVAASLCAFGVGTETDGSITSPSSVAGLVGLKPTVGLLSRDGIVPISFTQDTAGPMARSVADAALLLAAMVGEDPNDRATRAQRGHTDSSQRGRIDPAALTRLDAGALRGARLGVVDNLLGGHVRGVGSLFDDARRALQAAGATLVAAPLPKIEQVGAAELEVLLTELKHAMAAYLPVFAPNLPLRTLADLIAWNREHPQALSLFGQELFEQAAAKGGLQAPAYTRALATCRRIARRDGIDAVMRRLRLDALIAPTCSPAWPIDRVLGDAFGASATTPAAVAGTPHLTVPMGQVAGLPVGLSFFAGAFGEARLLNLGHAYEQATLLRRPPTYRARCDICG